MSFAGLMRHTFVHEARVAVMDGADPMLDDDGHTVTEDIEQGTFRGTAQLKRAREIEWANQGGAVLYDHDLFTKYRAISSLDKVWHDPARCFAQNDLGSVWFEVRSGIDDADRGHHMKYDARIVAAPEYPEGS